MKTVTLIDLINEYKPFIQDGKELNIGDVIIFELDYPTRDAELILKYVKSKGRDNLDSKGAINWVSYHAAFKYGIDITNVNQFGIVTFIREHSL